MKTRLAKMYEFKGGNIQVPAKLLDNNKFKGKLIYVYTLLKSISNHSSDNVAIIVCDSDDLAKFLQISKRSLAKYMTQLNNLGYVKKIKKQTKSTLLTIKLNPVTKNFIMTNSNIVKDILIAHSKHEFKNKVISISELLRLYLFYVNNYNIKLGYAYPSYKAITSKLGISTNTISIANEILYNADILNIIHGEKVANTVKREVNKYIPTRESKLKNLKLKKNKKYLNKI